MTTSSTPPPSHVVEKLLPVSNLSGHHAYLGALGAVQLWRSCMAASDLHKGCTGTCI